MKNIIPSLKTGLGTKMGERARKIAEVLFEYVSEIICI